MYFCLQLVSYSEEIYRYLFSQLFINNSYRRLSHSRLFGFEDNMIRILSMRIDMLEYCQRLYHKLY